MPSLRPLVLLAALVLAACGGSEPVRSVGPSSASPAPAPIRHAPCDDGGSGGVLIDGVCL